MWQDEILYIVFNRIKDDEEIQKIQEKYIDFKPTTSLVSQTRPTFPALVLQQLETPETGQDLDNTTVNAVMAGFQIDVIDNLPTRGRVNEITAIVQRIMKSMRFNVTRQPDMDTQDEKRSILRATRVIGSGDTL